MFAGARPFCILLFPSGLVILIGEAFAACRCVDDATIAEAGFEDEVAHEVVVAMCVDAERVVAAHGIAQDELHDAVYLAVARHAMDGGVGAGGGPGTVVDDGIRGVVARAKHEGGNEATALLDGVAGAGGDVGKEDVVAGIAVDPLGGVAVLRHEAAGTGEELLEGGEVGGTRGAHEVLVAEGDAVAFGSEGMGGVVGDVGHGGEGFWRDWGALGAQHCSSLCSQSEGDDFLGGLRDAATNIFRNISVALTLRAK